MAGTNQQNRQKRAGTKGWGSGGGGGGGGEDAISRRLSDAEAENERLRQQLAEVTERLEAEEARGNSRSVVDARLEAAEAENEALHQRLVEAEAALQASTSAPTSPTSAGAERPASATATVPASVNGEVASVASAAQLPPVGQAAREGATVAPEVASAASAAQPPPVGQAAREANVAPEATAARDAARAAEVRVQVAQKAKDRGNAALKEGQVEDAVRFYQRGIQSIQPLLDVLGGERGRPPRDAQAEEVVEAEVSLQLNLALAYVRLENYWGALEAAGTVLEHRPGNAKALYRRGVAFARLGERQSAAADFEEVLSQGPNADAQRELRLLKAELEKEKNKSLDSVKKNAFTSNGVASDSRKDELAGEDVVGAEESKGTPDQDLSGPAAALKAKVDQQSQDSAADDVIALRRTLSHVQQIKITAKLASTNNQAAVARKWFTGGLEALRSCRTTLDAEAATRAAPASELGRLWRELQALQVEFEAELSESGGSAVVGGEAPDGVANEAGASQPEEASKGRGADEQSEEDPMRMIRACVKSAVVAKELGNDALKQGDLTKAAEHYNKGLRMMEVLPIAETAKSMGIDFLDEDIAMQGPDMLEIKVAVELELSIHLNLALVYLRLKDYDGASDAATHVLEQRPNDQKALYRRGLARLRLGEMSDATDDFQTLLKNDPSMAPAIRKELETVCGVTAGGLHPPWADLFKGAGAQDGTDSAEQEDEEEEEEEDNNSLDSDDEVHSVQGLDDDDDDDEEEGAEAAAAAVAEEMSREGLQRLTEQALAMKVCGSEHFKKSEFDAASWCYGKGASQAARAYELCQKAGFSSSKEVGEELLQMEVSLHLNFSLCQLKLGDNGAAVKAATAALNLQPGNVKGLFRRAQANAAWAVEFDKKGTLDNEDVLAFRESAVADLKAVLVSEPQNPEARRELTSLRAAMKNKVGGQELEQEAKKAAAGGAADGAGDSPFAGMFGDQQAMKERARGARERRLAEELNSKREAGNTAHRVGDYASAQRHYTEALKLDPKATGLLLNRAAARLMLEDYAGCHEDCQKAVELQPDLAKAYVRGAKSLQLQGNFGGAEELLEKGLEKVSRSDRAELETQLRGARAALQSLRRVEGFLRATLELSAAESRQAEMEGRQALRLLDELDRQQMVPPSQTRPLRLRALLQTKEKPAEAQKLSEELLKESRSSGDVAADVWYWRGLALLGNGDRSSAKAALRQAAALAPAEAPPPATDGPSVAAEEVPAEGASVAAAAAVAAVAAAGSGPALAATRLLTKLVEADALKDKANSLFKARRWEEAVECYEDALKACPHDKELSAVLHTNSSAALRKLEQRADDAYRHAMKAIEANPKYAKAFFRRGVLHYDAGRWTQSFEDFRKAQDIEPNLQGIDSWLRRGRHAAREGKERKNLYRELGLLCDCEQEEVKKRYRTLARECHPDKVVDASPAERGAAENKFKSVNEAHEILGNEKSRKEYDFGKDSDHHQSPYDAFNRGRRAAPQPGSRYSRQPPGGFGGFGGFPGARGGPFGDNDSDDDGFFFG